MFIKMQFLKCGLCAVLYIVLCVVFIKMKTNFDVKKVSNMTTIKNMSRNTCFSITNRTFEKNVEAAIEELRKDELRGETIDLQESEALIWRVANTCAKLNLKTEFLVKRHFLYNAEHKSLYCWIRKAASTSFTKLFSDMSNRYVRQNFYKEVDFLSPETLSDLQRLVNDKTIFKLLVVRHPFQRLVSSYRDRIEDNNKYTAQAWLYARSILYSSRPELFRSNSLNSSTLQKIFFPDKRLKVIPSFREFSEWLLKQPLEHDDVHWAHYHTHCAVCDVSYNFILKLDEYTLGQANYVLSKLKLDKSKIYWPRLQSSRAGLTNFDTTCKYFHNLTTNIIIQLYKRYKIDFDMYNYKPDDYLWCAKKKIN